MMLKCWAILVGFLLFSTSFTSYSNNAYSEESSLPEWVKNIFVWYGEGQISEDELLNAIQYLIEIQIISVEKMNSFKDEGDFFADYIPAKNNKYKVIESVMKEAKVGESLARNLNDELKLPWDVKITHAECGATNALYIPKTHEIMMCYELLEYFYDFYQSMGFSEYDITAGTLGAYEFVFFHELGHALIQSYDLPVTGKEENAVDQLATLFLLSLNKDVAVSSISMLFFAEGIQQTEVEQLKFWDEHNLDLQRFYDTLCLSYGKMKLENNKMKPSPLLPKERADRCPAEFEKISDSWDTLLNPYLKYRSFGIDKILEKKYEIECTVC